MDRGLKKNFCGGQAAAFTLVEVMVTLTIMGFILLMIFGAFRLGIAAWEKGETNKEAYQRTRIASQLISQQMKSAVPYKIKTQKAEGDYLAFEGKARSLKFVSALSLKAKKASGLVYAFYEFREGGKGGGRLILYEGRVLNKNFLEENPPEDAAVPIFEGLADVRFEYYREEDPEKNRIGGWVEEWSAKEEKELPTALRLTLLSQKGGGKSEGVSTMILASLPSNRYEEVRTGPVRRMVPPITR
ncbi:MAG: prepilin-type N-terminal cleavage/methylation domain-containing protein [Deltaproteobacteria bacterium]|nr:prepilin-type N-terminal cleavage/methylation domain-containing protein [Deltaproteobacteria bacterium]